MDWREFWNLSHSIYVNDRHRELHYERIARDMAEFIPGPQARVLDYGCGEALSAGVLAGRCGRLYLYDAAPNVVSRLEERFAGTANVAVLPAEGIDAIDDGTIDLVLANSLIQYLSLAQFSRLLDLWRTKLTPSGRLVIADVVPRSSSTLHDVTSLLKFAREGGFLFAACRGLVATFFSPYRELRKRLGLARYSCADIKSLFEAHGWVGTLAPVNVGHNQSRMTFVAKRADVQASAMAATSLP